ncbi:MAG: hypothetical protein AAF282_18910, partial [Cyanobacteria bacterium P01_A01_bin.15]
MLVLDPGLAAGATTQQELTDITDMWQTSRIVYAVTGLGFIFASQSRKARTLKFMVGKAMRFLFSRRNAWVIFQNRDDSDALRSEGLVKSTLATLEDDARFARDQRSVLIP